MTSRRQSLRPIVVEVKPNNASKSLLCPSTPPTPSSPKAVRFSAIPDRASRPLTSTEAWSLYHFENHARQCSQCYRPHEVYQRGGRLCDAGHGLSQDVAYHVVHREGEIYSTTKDNSKLVRVEIPHGYSQLRSLLKAMERGIRSNRTVPVISYDRSYPISTRRAHDPQGKPETVIVEPANTTQRRHRSSNPTPSIIIANNNTDSSDEETILAATTLRSSPSKERRGSLYERDMQRKEKNYRVEIREPSSKDRRHQRKSATWL